MEDYLNYYFMEYEWNIMGAVYVRDRLLDVGIYVVYND